ncbi:GH25 family lysozyme [Collinsella aerofaciens]|uniref:GH25 family lysozyme n=1 Tax=Collinsella aerofaciens TaxID=74426 RepID=UPI00110741DB|nr:GH25 family lysozyme [Collinsella aerofaciens]MDB1876407.1 GH25 family lysozyme [Collinsella aerofaciens]
MKRLKASAALVCTLLMGWSQIIQPYSAYALSVQAAAASQSVSQTSNEYESQGASSQGAQDDASGSQGVTEWYGDDANAARPDGGVDSDSGEQPGIGIEESRVDESNGEAPTDDSTEMNSCEADSLEPNSWRFENGVLIDSDNGDIDAQSLTDDPLPNGAVARGIDVSNHQGTVDWNKVKAAGIDFAILKVGPVYGKPDDSFERNAAECERLGIPYGVYYYSYARSVEDANKEADRTLAWLGGHHPSLPVYYDLEDSYILQDPDFSKDKLTQIAQAFCNRMEAVGFKSGIYANLNWLNNYLNSPSLSGYDHWVAQYNWRCDYAGSYSFWQYSSSGNVPGVNGRCDMNYCFNGSLLNVDDSKMHIQYEAHVSNIGWMSSKRDGSTAGTTGQSKSVEDLKVSILNPVEDGSVQINANVSGVGWQGWDTPSASEGGTTGQGRAVEAVRLRLTGSLAKDYDVYYRVHASNIGWMAWAKDGEEAGTTGMSCSLEAVQIKLIKKGASHPDTSGYSHLEIPSVTYSSQVKGAWQNSVSAGEVSGTTGQGISITGFSAKTTSSVAGGIKYQLHLSNVGWTSGKTNGEQLSSTAETNSVEAIKISLSGDLATYFDVWYRVHVDNVGWLGWTKNGAVAGSTGYGMHVQAVQVRLTRKGANAPGSTVSPCLLGQPSAFANPMQKKIVDLARQVPSPGPGLCSEWIADIYERAGFRNVHTDACDYYWDYCKFTDYSQLKVGMVIAVPSHTHTRMGSIYGHVCLYIGNNQVMDNVGQIRTLDMAYWLDYYSTSYKPKWGWYDNVPLA